MDNDHKELMAEYGELMVQAEVINGKINECKQRISIALGGQPVPEVKEDAS